MAGEPRVAPHLGLGPLVILGARTTAGRPRDAFDGHGYKLPVTLPDGAVATLTIPRSLRRRVGFVTDRRRCARLTVEVAGGPTVRRRVPLGRRC